MWTSKRSLRVRLTAVAVVGVAVGSSSVRAEFSWDDVLAIIAGQKLESWTGDRTEEQEKDTIELAYEAFDEKHGDAAVARAMIGGSRLAHLPDGSNTDLTFRFVTASTGLPVDIPGLASVRYEKQTDPPGSIPTFEVIGTSTDADCDFCLPFTLSGFEPLVVAVPLDLLGNPLEVTGANRADVSNGVAINIDLSPPGVPDGSIGQPLRVAKLDPDGLSLEVSWDATTCPDVIDHHIVFGLGGTLPTARGEIWGLTGAECAIGDSSPYVWNGVPDAVEAGDDSGLFWFLVLANDGLGTEGAWGATSEGLERFGAGAGGSSTMCRIKSKSLAYTCGNGICDVDIRTTVLAARDDPADTQLNYDAINRSGHLYGLVPFERLFSSTLDELAPHFLGRLQSVESCTGLPTDEAATEAAYLDAAAEAGGLSLGEIIALLPGSLPNLQAKITVLRSLGIGFPKPAANDVEASDRAVAVEAIVSQAGTHRYRDFYFLTANDLTPEALAAIEQGKTSGVLKMTICAPGDLCEPQLSFGICDNDRCCSKGTGTADTDECLAEEDKQCNRPPPSRAFCSIASDNCG